MRLLGADFPAGESVAAGKPMPVILYFSTDREIEGHYTLFLHLAGEDDRILSQVDGVPAAGRHSTHQWRPGEVFADEYALAVDENAIDELATLSMGFYPYDDPTARLSAFDASGVRIGDRVELAKVRVHDAVSPPAVAQSQLEAVWEHGIALADMALRMGPDGMPQSVTVTWQATEDVAADYTVFVQTLAEDGSVLAQIDQQPQAGDYPTSTWAEGDVIEDTYVLVWPEGGAPAWQQVIIGLYGQDGTRLLLVEPDAGRDFYVVARHE